MNKLTTFVLTLCMAAGALISCGGGASKTGGGKEPEVKTEVRGVWVPAPRFTKVMTSYDNIKAFVADLDELNMNSIFLVTYANDMTVYNSDVLLRNTSYTSIDQTNMLSAYMPMYDGKSGDPVKDLIDEAHARDIKVFFWYEYGFMSHNSSAGMNSSKILAKHPNWKGIGNDGVQSNYNKTDYYLNSYDPEVQAFLLELISEALTRYPDVDGVQGDDRMPAAPRNSGYDDVTKEMFHKEKGYYPPQNFNDSEWVAWRLKKLNSFGRDLYDTVKRLTPKALVTFSPNPYPWCESNLMQDWPQWINDGIVDLLAVQCYRRDVASYKTTVNECLTNINAAGGRKPLFAPGMLMMVGSDCADPAIFRNQLIENTMLHLDGSVFFYNEGLNNPEMRAVLQQVYTSKRKFPSIK